uniref:Ovule protein n=1 Tax=Elaeophora elaphi TaxID=1147741 RepID=A0A0R3RV55_9BILA
MNCPKKDYVVCGFYLTYEFLDLSYASTGSTEESLRGSRKLLSLENHRSRKESPGYKNGALSNGNTVETGYANNAYVAGDTFCDNTNMDKTEPIPLEQVMISMNRVAEHLEKREGRGEESKLLRDFFMQKPVQEAIESSVVIHKKTKVSLRSVRHHHRSNHSFLHRVFSHSLCS